MDFVYILYMRYMGFVYTLDYVVYMILDQAFLVNQE